jgi:O-antigen/teichoic acid export membrane protein
MIMEENMGKYPLKRSLIVGIIFLFLSTTCIPVLASEGKPDLIVVSMGFVPYGDGEVVRVAFATV